MFDLKDLTPAHFQTLIGSSITIENTEDALRVESVELIKSPSPRAQPFSTTFSAPAAKAGGQGIYHLLHPELGVLAIFLVPIEQKNGMFRFEATFN